MMPIWKYAWEIIVASSAWRPRRPSRVRSLLTELAARIQQRRAELLVLAEKIGEIETDADEHRYVPC